MSISKLAVAGALTLALTSAFTGLAQARGGGGGGGGGGGSEATSSNAVVLPGGPTHQRYGAPPPASASMEACHYSTYWGGIVCESRGGRR
ncbi:hypothetical protein [Phreatobacter cathodiphilus]|nr:hypothetical protein [Phreatobacter cathodiphilus]